MSRGRIIAILTCLVVVGVGYFLCMNVFGGFPDGSVLREHLESLDPFWFFASMSVLPALGVPVAPFLLVAGAIYSIELAILGCSTALTINMILTWFVSGRWLRPFCEKLLTKFGYSVPDFSRGNFIKMAIVLRLTPAFPFALQNYLLGVARMPFLWYLLISVPISLAVDSAIILFGEALLGGDLGMIVGAVCLIALMSYLVRSVRGRLNRKDKGISLDESV